MIVVLRLISLIQALLKKENKTKQKTGLNVWWCELYRKLDTDTAAQSEDN